MLFNKSREESIVPTPLNPRQMLKPVPLDQPVVQAARVAPAARSVIDSCLHITGTIEGVGELHVEGEVNGDIRCKHLTVGHNAIVNGNIAADEVAVRGKVKGTIGANRVILMDTANVDGDILHKRLAIEEGATFEGAARLRENPIEDIRAMTASPGTTFAGDSDLNAISAPARLSNATQTAK